MKCPNFNEEKKLWKKGYTNIAGLDEAGRGPLAGPVVAAAFAINPKHEARNTKQIRISKIQNSKHVSDFGFRISEVRDSKRLSAKQREKVYKKLIGCKNILWGIGIVSEKVIDKINILEATKLAMKKAVLNLKKKSKIKPYISTHDRGHRCKLDFLILDGNFKIENLRNSFGFAIPQKSVVKGDQKVFSVAAASIIAKVTRDRIMKKEHKKYPQYGFDKHKGYGTKAHFTSLEKFGPCKIHRKTFWPVSNLI